jgi:hypothetical protein
MNAILELALGCISVQVEGELIVKGIATSKIVRTRIHFEDAGLAKPIYSSVPKTSIFASLATNSGG